MPFQMLNLSAYGNADVLYFSVARRLFFNGYIVMLSVYVPSAIGVKSPSMLISAHRSNLQCFWALRIADTPIYGVPMIYLFTHSR